MKKIVIFAVSCALILVFFVGCGGANDKEKTDGTTGGAVTDADTSAPASEKSGDHVTEDTKKTEKGSIYGTFYGSNGVSFTIEENGIGSFVENGEKFDAFWMQNDDTVVIWDYGDHAFSGKLEGTDLSGMWQYETPMVFSNHPVEIVVVEPTLPDPPQNPSVFEPVTLELYGDTEITILGAELFRNSEKEEAIRVYFDVTNLSDQSRSFYGSYSTSLVADGFGYVHCSEFDSDEAAAVNTPIGPGKTLRCASEFYYKWEGNEALTFSVVHDEYKFASLIDAIDKLDPGTYTVEAGFDPAKLPAFPEGGLPANP